MSEVVPRCMNWPEHPDYPGHFVVDHITNSLWLEGFDLISWFKGKWPGFYLWLQRGDFELSVKPAPNTPVHEPNLQSPPRLRYSCIVLSFPNPDDLYHYLLSRE